MCNGLNYTKLNRRLTDIKSDCEKLVGKRILLPAHHQHHQRRHNEARHQHQDRHHYYQQRCFTPPPPSSPSMFSSCSCSKWEGWYSLSWPTTTTLNTRSRKPCGPKRLFLTHIHRHQRRPQIEFSPILFKLITQYLFRFTPLHPHTVS